MIAQGAHASMAVAVLYPDDDRVIEWLVGDFTKIVVQVNSEEELLSIKDNADDHGLIVELIVDNGKTEFNGVKTPTCLAIGAAEDVDLEPVTGHLKLL